MSQHPGSEIGEAIGRIALKLQRLGILLLPAGSFQIHDQLPRDRDRDARSEVFLDECQGEVHARRNPTGGEKRSIFHKERVMIYVELRETAGHILGEPPMSRYGAAVEKTRRRERIDPCADRSDAANFRRTIRNPTRDRRTRRTDPRASASGNDERVERRSIAQSGVGLKEQARFRAKWFTGQTDNGDFVTSFRRPVVTVDGRNRKRIGRPDEIQTLDAIVSYQPHTEWSHSAQISLELGYPK